MIRRFNACCLLFCSLMLCSLLLGTVEAQNTTKEEDVNQSKYPSDIAQPFPDRRKIKFEIHLNVEYPEDSERTKFQMTTILPQSIPGYQKIKVRVLPRPTEIIEENGNQYARWVRHNPPRSFRLKIIVDGYIYRRDATVLGTQKKFKLWKDKQLEPFLIQEKWIDAEEKTIKDAAAKIKQGESNTETARNIHEFMINHMKPGVYTYEAWGSVVALEKATGDCTEYSDLFVALCRAKKIPARVITGLVTNWYDTPKHKWVEYYDEKMGWVPLDVLHAESRSASVTAIQNKYVYLSNIRNAQAIKGSAFWYYQYWGDAPEVKGEITVLQATGQKDLPKKAEY